MVINILQKLLVLSFFGTFPMQTENCC